jgi:hypothetical protein
LEVFESLSQGVHAGVLLRKFESEISGGLVPSKYQKGDGAKSLHRGQVQIRNTSPFRRSLQGGEQTVRILHGELAKLRGL